MKLQNYELHVGDMAGTAPVANPLPSTAAAGPSVVCNDLDGPIESSWQPR